MKKIVFVLLSVSAAAACTAATQAELGFDAAVALGALTAAIILWISSALPDYVTALFLAVCFIVFSKVPCGIVLGAFSKPSLWLLLSAFGLTLCLSKCGLLDRLARFIMNLFPKNFMGRVLGLTAVGFISAPFVPSMSAKAAVFAPLAMSIGQASGYKLKSKESAGLFFAMLAAIRSPGPLFISASVNGYTLSGLLPQPYSDYFTMSRWFLAALPWFLIVTALSLFCTWLFFSPKSGQTVSTDAFTQKLPPMSKKERLMALIITATMILWMTENLHGIPAYIISLTALCICISCNIINSREFCSDMNWNAVLFIGVVLEITSVFKYLGINEWFIRLFTPLFSYFAGKPYQYILLIALSTVALRFVIVSEIALINIYMVFLIPFTIGIGINPWIACFTVYAVVCPWFFLYQSPVYMAAYYATEGKMLKPSQAAFSSGVYIIICIIALLLSAEYWIKYNIFFI